MHGRTWRMCFSSLSCQRRVVFWSWLSVWDDKLHRRVQIYIRDHSQMHFQPIRPLSYLCTQPPIQMHVDVLPVPDVPAVGNVSNENPRYYRATSYQSIAFRPNRHRERRTVSRAALCKRVSCKWLFYLSNDIDRWPTYKTEMHSARRMMQEVW